MYFTELSGLGDNSSWVGESPNLLIKNPTEKGYSSIETKLFTRTNSVLSTNFCNKNKRGSRKQRLSLSTVVQIIVVFCPWSTFNHLLWDVGGQHLAENNFQDTYSHAPGEQEAQSCSHREKSRLFQHLRYRRAHRRNLYIHHRNYGNTPAKDNRPHLISIIDIQDKHKQTRAQEGRESPLSCPSRKPLVTKTTLTCTFLILNYNRKIISLCNIYSSFQRY